MFNRRAFILCFVIFLFATAPNKARSDDDLHRFFSQLRKRFLFELAEGECVRRIAEFKPPTSEHAQYTLELSKTYSEHAKYVSGDEQQELWNQSRIVLRNLWNRVPNHAYRLELEKEAALSYSEEAHYLRWLAQIRSHDEQFRQQTLQTLQTAIEKNRVLEQHLNQLSQTRKRNSRKAVPSVRLRQLQNEIRFHYARTILDHLYLQKPNSPNRRAYLRQGLILVETIGKSSPHAELKWKTQILQIDFYTQAALYEEVQKIYDHPTFVKTAAQNPAAFLASHVRFFHAKNDYAKASQELAEYFLRNEIISGELYFFNILNNITLWQNSLQNLDIRSSKIYFERIEELAKRCQQDLGGYWGFRCLALKQNSETIQQYGSNLAAAVLKAQSLFSSDRILDSATEYKSAFRIAARENRHTFASEFLYLSASLYVQAGQYEAAQSTLQEYLIKYPIHKNRPQAHLLFAYCLGQVYAKETTQTNQLRYREALIEHRREFKKHSTFVEATWMLALLEEQRQQIYSKALDLYREIPTTHSRYAESQVAVARCYESILDRLRKTRQPTEEMEAYAINQLAIYLRGFSRSSELSVYQAEVLVRLSRILLNKDQPDYVSAEQYLKRVFDAWNSQKPKMKSKSNLQARQSLQRWTTLINMATQFRIVSMAGSNQLDRAKQLMDRLSEIDIANALAILDGLTVLNTGRSADFRFKMGRLQLLTAEKLESRRRELSVAQKQKLNRCLAQAHVAMNKPEKAIAIYENLYRADPKDDRLLLKLAGLLSDCKTSDCQKRALVYWKKIGSQKKQGSDAWLDARYHMALCQFNLKNYSECRKILSVVKLLYPNTGPKDLRDKIGQLLETAKRFARR